jgi:hypothetical protein
MRFARVETKTTSSAIEMIEMIMMLICEQFQMNLI